MAHVVVGPVAGLWRSPVKSMQSEELDAVPVRRGFLGDRAYALIDQDSLFRPRAFQASVEAVAV